MKIGTVQSTTMDPDELALLYSPLRNVSPLSPSYLMRTPPARSVSPWSVEVVSTQERSVSPVKMALGPWSREAGCDVPGPSTPTKKLTGIENDSVFTFVEDYLIPSIVEPVVDTNTGNTNTNTEHTIPSPSVAEKPVTKTGKTVATGSIRWACDKCDNSYASKQMRDRHVLYTHAETNEVDWVASKKQKDARATNDAEKRFKCSACERSFSRKGHLEEHLRATKNTCFASV